MGSCRADKAPGLARAPRAATRVTEAFQDTRVVRWHRRNPRLVGFELNRAEYLLTGRAGPLTAVCD